MVNEGIIVAKEVGTICQYFWICLIVYSIITGFLYMVNSGTIVDIWYVND